MIQCRQKHHSAQFLGVYLPNQLGSPQGFPRLSGHATLRRYRAFALFYGQLNVLFHWVSIA